MQEGDRRNGPRRAAVVAAALSIGLAVAGCAGSSSSIKGVPGARSGLAAIAGSLTRSAAQTITPAPAPAALAPAAAHTGSMDPLANVSPYMVLISSTPPPAWKQDYRTYFEELRRLGLSWAYVDLTWSDVEQIPGVYDFSGMDQVVADAHLHGVQLMMQVQTESDWVQPAPAQALADGGKRTNTALPVVGLTGPNTAAPMNIDGSIPFWKAVVQRYRPGGELARSQRWHDGYGVDYYEVENEPDTFPWPAGNWGSVPHDYALYLSRIAAAVHGIDRSIKLVAPALSTGPDEPDCVVALPSPAPPCPYPGWPAVGARFLQRVLDASPTTQNLAFASDQYRASIAQGAPLVGGGPSIDVYSFHWDFVDPSQLYGAQRAQQLESIVHSYATQPGYPTTPTAQFWDTEGGPVSGGNNDPTDTIKSAQLGLQLLGAGVSRFCWQLPSTNLPPFDPFTLMTQDMTTFFPSGSGVQTLTPQLSAAAGQQVEASSWRNPATGLRSYGLWAQDEPSGSGTTGPDFTVPVPISTPYAIVTAADWSRKLVAVHNGVVPVLLHRADPSPVLFVAESNGPVATTVSPGPITYNNTADYNATPWPFNVEPATPNLSITRYSVAGGSGKALLTMSLAAPPSVTPGSDSSYYLVTWESGGKDYYAGLIDRLAPALGPSLEYDVGVLTLDSSGNVHLSPDTSVPVSGAVNGSTITWSFPYGAEASAAMIVDHTAAFTRQALDWGTIFPPSFIGGDQAPEDSVPGQDEGAGGAPFA